MTYTVKIECDNAAFRPDPVPEIARILSRLACDVRVQPTATTGEWRLYGAGGAQVGTAKMSKR